MKRQMSPRQLTTPSLCSTSDDVDNRIVLQKKPDIFLRIKMWAVEIAGTTVFLVVLYVVTRSEIHHLLGK